MQEYWTQPATYDPIAFNNRFRPEALDVWLPHFVRLLDLAASQRVLDLGCGTGGFALAIAHHTRVHVIGVDVAPHLLRYAVAQSRTLPSRWVLGQAEALPVADQTIDRVLMSLVLHQIAHRERAIQEVYRVLRPGGRFLVRTVAPEVTLQAWVLFPLFSAGGHRGGSAFACYCRHSHHVHAGGVSGAAHAHGQSQRPRGSP